MYEQIWLKQTSSKLEIRNVADLDDKTVKTVSLASLSEKKNASAPLATADELSLSKARNFHI